MLVTIMCDASLCVKTGASGYGFYCISERGKINGGGMFKSKLKDSYEAEYKAVANAIHYAIEKSIALKNDTILIQTDNQGVVDLINNVRPPREDLLLVQDYINVKVNNLNLKLIGRHVKGHTSKKENRYRSNNLCDQTAGFYMEQARNLFSKSQ